MNICILATDSISTNIVTNHLYKNGHTINLIIENSISKKIFLKNRIRKLGYLKVLGQLFFSLLITIYKKLQTKKIRDLYSALNLNYTKNNNIKTFRVNSINSEECIKILKLQQPDIIILNGTRIVSKRVLDSIDSIFVNTHCGITPKYRGVHGGYWAAYYHDYNNLGVTVHLVDKGIDTGAILYQNKIEIDHTDNFFTYPIKQYAKALPLIDHVLADFQQGKLSPVHRNDLPSFIWSHPTIIQYLYGCIFKGIR